MMKKQDTSASKKHVRKFTEKPYVIHKVDGDGDCGYTAFGIIRTDAHRLMVENVSNMEIMSLIFPAVHEALLMEKFLTYLKTKGCISKKTTIKKIEADPERYKSNPAILRAYIDYDIQDKQIDDGWAHPCILQALAKIRKIKLYIWQLDEIIGPVPHTYYPQIKPKGAKERIDLLFINNNHFHRLEWLATNNSVQNHPPEVEEILNPTLINDNEEDDFISPAPNILQPLENRGQHRLKFPSPPKSSMKNGDPHSNSSSSSLESSEKSSNSGHKTTALAPIRISKNFSIFANAVSPPTKPSFSYKKIERDSFFDIFISPPINSVNYYGSNLLFCGCTKVQPASQLKVKRILKEQIKLESYSQETERLVLKLVKYITKRHDFYRYQVSVLKNNPDYKDLWSKKTQDENNTALLMANERLYMEYLYEKQKLQRSRDQDVLSSIGDYLQNEENERLKRGQRYSELQKENLETRHWGKGQLANIIISFVTAFLIAIGIAVKPIASAFISDTSNEYIDLYLSIVNTISTIALTYLAHRLNIASRVIAVAQVRAKEQDFDADQKLEILKNHTDLNNLDPSLASISRFK